MRAIHISPVAAVLLLLHAGSAAAVDLSPCLLRSEAGGPAVAAQCGRIEAPLDYENPGAGTLGLNVAVVPSLSGRGADDAVTVLAGGPGGAATTFYAGFRGAFMALSRRHDVVLVDQRGTGDSLPLDCPMPEDLLLIPDRESTQADARACLEDLPADPRLFTTSVAVRDLDRVRALLGYKRLHLYGASYGTRVAQHYLRRYPENTGAVILDGVVPAGRPLGPRLAINAQAALDSTLARCASDPKCAERFPDLSGQLRKVSSRVAEAPVSLTLAHPLTGDPVEYRLGPLELATALRLLSYAPESSALLPLLIDAAAHGRPEPIALQALMAAESIAGTLSLGMHNAVVCTEDLPWVAPGSVDRAALEATYLGTAQYDTLVDLCDVWPAGVMDPDLQAPLRSAHPVLLLSGELDPVTPPAWAEEAMAGLSTSRHVVARGQGHGAAIRGCLPRLMADFVDAESFDGLDFECVERLRAPPFLLSFSGPAP
jgi:pimeloyl-ACP methyl ester carboxylesterase